MQKKFIFGVLFAILVILVVVLVLVFWPKKEEKNYDAFAKCLAEKVVAMYGADWCVHCQNEKRAFGSSFKYVPYVECPDEPKKCIDAGVEGYPTWIFKDGKKLVGEQGLEKLSKESGCNLE